MVGHTPVFALDLGRSADKLKREQEQRSAALKRKQEAERRTKERARKVAAEAEERERLRRLALQEAEERQRIEAAAELERNNGVLYHATLAAVPRDEAAADIKGIVRRADKLTLPPSARATLMAQDAPKNGPMFFELSVPETGATGREGVEMDEDRASTTRRRATYSGLLDFTAIEGTVGLPAHTARNLFGEAFSSVEEVQVAGPLDVRYTKLPKGTYAKLQPLWSAFQRDVEDVKLALEAALHDYTVLSEGDTVLVKYMGSSHALQVLELRPSPAVSIIDTDLEVDLEVSVEAAAAQKKAEEERRAAEEAKRRAEEEARQQEEDEARRAAELEAAAAQHAATKAAALPPEPSQEERAEGLAIEILLRFPDGSRRSRTFRRTDAPGALFDFAEAGPMGGLAFGQAYKLITGYPPRSLAADAPTLQDAGLTGKQEALLVQSVE